MIFLFGERTFLVMENNDVVILNVLVCWWMFFGGVWIEYVLDCCLFVFDLEQGQSLRELFGWLLGCTLRSWIFVCLFAIVVVVGGFAW